MLPNPYQSPEELEVVQPETSSQEGRRVKRALATAVAGNIAAVLCPFLLFRHHAGELIMPMDIAVYIFLVSVLTAGLVLPSARRGLFTPGHRVQAAVASCLAITPFIVGSFVLNLLARALQLRLR